jgi:energy-coupling factor transporter ATP-binding protein EcfA2
VRENLLRGRVNSRILRAAERVDAILRTVLEPAGLVPAALLMGLEFRVGEGGKYLSGGQKQKVSIARAIFKNPSILLMDEATASLDESSQARVVEMIRDNFTDKTVVSISHRLSTIRDFHKVVVLDRGEVSQMGTYADLAIADGVFRNLVNQERGIATPRPASLTTASTALKDLQHNLALSDVFGSMNEEQLTFLAQACRVIDCKADEILFHRGDSGDELYLVLEGSVSFLRDPNGDASTIVTTYGPGRVFGELALFGHGVRTLTARTGPATRLMALGREALIKLMAADHRIAVGLLGAVARRLIEADERRFAPAPAQA